MHKKTMKKIALSLAAAACLMGAVSQAQAQSSGAYAIGNVNYTKIEDFKEFGGGGRLGFQFNQNFAVEGSFDYYGEVKENIQISATQTAAASLNLQSLGLAAVFRAPLTPELALRGSLGMARFKAKAKVAGFSESETTSEPVFGIGVEYAINKGMSVLTEYRYANSDGTKLHNLTTGLKFGF